MLRTCASRWSHPTTCCHLLAQQWNLFGGYRVQTRNLAFGPWPSLAMIQYDVDKSLNASSTSEIGNNMSRTRFRSRIDVINVRRQMTTLCHLPHDSDNRSPIVLWMDSRSRSSISSSRHRQFSDDRAPLRPGDNRLASRNSLYRRSRVRLRKTHKAILETRQRVKEVKEKVEEMITRENVVTIPNILCGTRIVLAPVIGYLVVQTNFELALGLFAFAGITDLLDGYIARNFKNQQTMFGSFLDPFADKLLVFCLVISLTYRDMIPVPLTALILFRDVLLVFAACYVRYISLPPPVGFLVVTRLISPKAPAYSYEYLSIHKTLQRYFDVTMVTARLKPTALSKANTAVQLVLVAATLMSPLLPFDPSAYLHFMWYFTATTTVVSALSYATSKDTYQLLRKFTEVKDKNK